MCKMYVCICVHVSMYVLYMCAYIMSVRIVFVNVQYVCPRGTGQGLESGMTVGEVKSSRMLGEVKSGPRHYIIRIVLSFSCHYFPEDVLYVVRNVGIKNSKLIPVFPPTQHIQMYVCINE